MYPGKTIGMDVARDEVRRAKAQLELHMTGGEKNYIRVFYSYIN